MAWIGKSYEKPRQDITDYLSKHFSEGVACEVGVCRGEFSKHLLQNWNCKKLYLVDFWDHTESYREGFHKQNENYEKMISNLEPFKDRIVVCRGESAKIAKTFEDEMFDFIYIDADHSYEACKLDLESYWPKLKQGGIMMGDDYTLTPNEKMDFPQCPGDLYFGVNQAVNEFADKHKKIINLEYTGDWVYANGVKSRNFIIQK